MRAISLWQPWASLVATGRKEFETRHWSTNYRGYLAIHATKRWTKEEIRILDMYRKHFPYPLDIIPPNPPLSAVLCVVNLVDVLPTDEVRPYITTMERAFGNFEPGRFAWKMEVVKVFDPPIPAKGAQGFWRWDQPAEYVQGAQP